MSEQNGHAAGAAPGRVMRRSLSQLGSDVITLVELQTALFQVDLRDWSRGVVKSVVALVAALALLAASAPILFLSLGYFINDVTDLSLAASMLIAAASGIFLACVCAAVAVWRIKREQGVFNRFRGELQENVSWLKQVLTNPTEVDPTRVL